MGGFFDVAGVTPLLGRALTHDDDRRGTEKTIVLSFGAWQRLFGGLPEAVGRQLVARNFAYTIVGVMPADFEFPPRRRDLDDAQCLGRRRGESRRLQRRAAAVTSSCSDGCVLA